MEAWEQGRVEEKGAGRKFHELAYPEDLDYLNKMVEWAGKAEGEGERGGALPRMWVERDYEVRKRFADIKRAFAGKGDARREIRRLGDLDYDS